MTSKTQLSLMTLNIRRVRGDDGINNWGFRKDLVAGMLRRRRPDVAVFQEMLIHQLHDLEAMLPGYEWIGVGRDDGAEAGEFAPVFYRGLTVARSGTFWFSDTPDVPSCTWPGMTRICTWVEFAGSVPFALFNVHLEYGFESTQLKSVGLLQKRLCAYSPDHPVVLAGDFNFNPYTPPYDALRRFVRDGFHSAPAAEDASSGRPSSNSATCHEFTGRTQAPQEGAGRIDSIWYRGAAAVSDFAIITEGAGDPSGVFMSDHWPVTCRLLVG